MKKKKHGSIKTSSFWKDKPGISNSRVVFFIMAFAIIGSALLILTKAAIPTASIEPETKTITAPAISGNDTSASAGKYVQFKSAATTPGNYSPTGNGRGPHAGLPARTAQNGDITVTTAGTVIQNLDIRGSIHVKANNVTIQNCTFKVPSCETWSSKRNFVNQEVGSGMIVKDSVFDGTGADGQPAVYDAITSYSGQGVTVQNVKIRMVGNGAELATNTTFVDSIMTEIWGPQGSGWHADGLQWSGGENITVRNNYIDPGDVRAIAPAGVWTQTSVIALFAHLGNLKNILVEGNIAGSAGYTFYAGSINGHPYTATNITFKNNVVLRNAYRQYGVWYPEVNATRTGNIYDDGTPVNQ